MTIAKKKAAAEKTKSAVNIPSLRVPSKTEIDLELGLPKVRQLLTPREVAEYMRCDVDHIYHLLDAGELTVENMAGEIATGRNRPRHIRINRASAIAFRARRRIKAS